MRERVAKACRRSSVASGGRALILAGLLGQSAAARELVVLGGGVSVPLGKTADFTDSGSGLELRYRHFNTARSAFEFAVGYYAGSLSGSIPQTIEQYEDLVREKNLRAQQASQPGQGFLVAEYGSLETYNFDANFTYRFSQRGRFSPFASAGAGLYVWRVPFRLQFFNVPSFGEQHAYDPIGNSGSQFVFDDRYPPQVIDYTKHEASGGLNAAFGIDLRLTRQVGFEVEARGHLLFSSGKGNEEDPADDQPYLDNLGFLRCAGSLTYRF